MRKTAIIALCAALVCSALPARAGGRISLYADPTRSSCELVDVFPDVVQIHIFYEGDLGAQSVFFVAPTPGCWNDAVWLGDVILDPWLSGLGDTHDLAKGTLINLLGCNSGTLYLGYMSFHVMGHGKPCCPYEIVGSDIDGFPGVIDCGSNVVEVETGALMVNPNPSCGCVDGNIVVAVEETTWGRVKSLYR